MTLIIGFLGVPYLYGDKPDSNSDVVGSNWCVPCAHGVNRTDTVVFWVWKRVPCINGDKPNS
ncbi:hypothetical protein GPY51_19605 [Photorhabdus laumondii subsp. laumondii]|nr:MULTISPECIES: hypothetical protein [Photorhabdus]AWK40694.1 hypothetical protein A4R40_03750 [Photorhabdus laumondii subsp. laumondii]AXG46031.1 hypothetical protein PluTT01m_03850 [Photorhabdus laumondii subsp. laumondii]MCC8384188.1 hypothetical protein [Photorhabdus laumondii]MCC8388457.1 hypothetical protein [Photorhabdus laumondii]MCC8414116.1 hypothetical protein [Photorhabdus laumondii]